MSKQTEKDWGAALEEAIQKRFTETCIHEMIQVLEQRKIQNLQDAMCVQAAVGMLKECSHLQAAIQIYEKASEIMSEPLPPMKIKSI